MTIDGATGEITELLAPDDARALTDRIKQTLTIAHGLIIEAYRGRADQALGYDSWDTYCVAEFAGARMVRLDREQRREMVAEMRQAGMSTRAIASGIGISQRTVADDALATEQDCSDAQPPTVVSLDGRERPATRPTPEPTRPTPIERRRPLVDSFRDAAINLARSAERLAKLTADDRWRGARPQIARAAGSDLVRVLDSITGFYEEADLAAYAQESEEARNWTAARLTHASETFARLARSLEDQ